ncbi:MAG: putative hydrogenase nickel incorporation protein HypA 1 [Rhodomicrobium sp.]|nr:MAG: putative hydrogenase nickel incorporation protein HypA 1 [Rhodomicrobium sp.]
MHEMSICEGILQVLEAESQTKNFKVVKKVFVEIGPLSGVEVEALRFSFDVVMKGSLADTAVLEVIETDAKAWCMNCNEPVIIKQRFDDCPQCGSAQIQVTSGEELAIKELEVD